MKDSTLALNRKLRPNSSYFIELRLAEMGCERFRRVATAGDLLALYAGGAAGFDGVPLPPLWAIERELIQHVPDWGISDYVSGARELDVWSYLVDRNISFKRPLMAKMHELSDALWPGDRGFGEGSSVACFIQVQVTLKENYERRKNQEDKAVEGFEGQPEAASKDL